MFSAVTWSEYFLFVVIFLMIYYLYVGIKFYSDDIKLILSGGINLYDRIAGRNYNFRRKKNVLTASIQQDMFDALNPAEPLVEQPDPNVQKVQELTTNLKVIIGEAASRNYLKEEFFLSLKVLLRKYHFLKGSPFVVAINNLIVSECEKYGYIKLDAEERVLLWNE